MWKFISRTVLVIVFTLLIFVGIYFIMGLFEFVPTIDTLWDCSKYLEEDSILYNKELYQYYNSIKNTLFLFIPLGFVLFVSPWGQSDFFVWKILSLAGLALMVVSSLILHIQLMNFEPIENASVGFSKMTEPHAGLFFLFPLTCLYSTISFHTIGYNQFLNDWDTFKANILSYLYVLGGAILLILLISLMFDLTALAIISLVVGCISLVVMGVSRLKNGSPFEY